MDSKITRYMPFANLVAFLKDGLHVPISTSFEDKWEGLLLLRRIEPERQKAYLDIYRKIAPWVYVSCWHKEDHESYGMWKIYGRLSQAVAVQTTSEKLSQAYLTSAPNTLAYLDEVTYVLPEVQEAIKLPRDIKIVSKAEKGNRGVAYFPVLLSFFLKHRAFEFEKEVRLVGLAKDCEEGGQNLKRGLLIDYKGVPDFIESVRVSPGAPVWFREVVADSLSKYRVNAPLMGSDLEWPEALDELTKV